MVVLISFFMSAALIKFGISYVLAGPSGLTVFGPAYGLMASTTAPDPNKYVRLLLLALENFKGHVMVISLIYGLPITVAIIVTVNAIFTKNDLAPHAADRRLQLERLSFLSLAVVLNLICVVALFTATIADTDLYETAYRLHLRYYNFALPLFYIVTVATVLINFETKKSLQYFFGAVVLALGIYAVLTNLNGYTPSHLDNPELFVLSANELIFKLIGGFFILALCIWLISQRKGMQFYFYLLLPLYVCISLYQVSAKLSDRRDQDIYDPRWPGKFPHL